jgi:hypothetical protein
MPELKLRPLKSLRNDKTTVASKCFRSEARRYINADFKSGRAKGPGPTFKPKANSEAKAAGLKLGA